MTPEWEPIIKSELEKHRDAQSTVNEIRDINQRANILRCSLDAQMDEAWELLALADQLILTAFRHFGGVELAQWRQRYAAFVRDTQEAL